MIGWIKFFLKGVIEVSDNTKNKFKNVLGLMKEISEYEELDTTNMKKIINYMYQKPTFTRKMLSEELEISANSTSTAINKLIELDLINETTGYNRNQVFTFKKYINLFKK